MLREAESCRWAQTTSLIPNSDRTVWFGPANGEVRGVVNDNGREALGRKFQRSLSETSLFSLTKPRLPAWAEIELRVRKEGSGLSVICPTTSDDSL